VVPHHYRTMHGCLLDEISTGSLPFILATMDSHLLISVSQGQTFAGMEHGLLHGHKTVKVINLHNITTQKSIT